MNAPNPKAALQELRGRAERRRLVTEATASDTDPSEVQRLVQELQVHQIELEMQYEELLLAQVDAENSRKQYLDLYEFAPVGYCTLTANGTVRQLNLRMCQLLGEAHQKLTGRRLALFVPMAERLEFSQFMARLWASPGQRLTCELPMTKADDTLFFAQIEGETVLEGLDESQPPTSCRLVVLDVTARRRAADELAASEARFRATFEQSKDGMVLLEDHHFVDLNLAAVHLLGYHSPHEVAGRHLLEFWPELQPDGRRSLEVLNECITRAQLEGWCRIEWQRTNPAGQVVWDEMSFNPVLVQGQPLLHAAWRDITARKHNEVRLQESEARLNLALAASETGTFTWTIAGNRLQWDERAQAVFGLAYSPDVVPVEVLSCHFHPADVARVWGAIHAAAAAGRSLTIDYRIVWADGTLHHVNAASRAVVDEQGHTTGFVGTLRDVTSQHAAQEELNYKSLVLERLLSNMPMVLARFRPDGRYLESVGQGLRALGLADNELVGYNALEYFPAFRPAVRQVLAGESARFSTKIAVNDRPVMFQNYGFFDEQRQQVVMLSVDVTEAEQQRQRLLSEKEFTQSLLENSVDGIVAVDQNGHITAWNTQATTCFGPTAAVAVGRSLYQVLPHLDNDQARQIITRVLAGELVVCEGLPFGHRPGHYDAYHVPLKQPASATPTGVLILFRDVTERNRLAEEATSLKLRQQQAVLSAILTTQEEERRRIAEALHNGLGQLLYGTRLHLDALPTSPAVRATQDLLNEAIRTTRTISFELTPDILEDFGLAVALEELVKRIPRAKLLIDLNLSGLTKPLPKLLQTAAYRIVQELLNNVMKHAQAQEVFVQVSREDQLHISVEDDGVGFDPAGPASRTGIGLAGIRTRVNLLSGVLTIKSRVGQGTSVSLTLPIPAG
jgi:PAS domain S-box-containing protein